MCWRRGEQLGQDVWLFQVPEHYPWCQTLVFLLQDLRRLTSELQNCSLDYSINAGLPWHSSVSLKDVSISDVGVGTGVQKLGKGEEGCKASELGLLPSPENVHPPLAN